MKVIAVLLAFAATATAQYRHAEAEFYNEETKHPMGKVFLSQPPKSGIIGILFKSLPLPSGTYAITVFSERTVVHSSSASPKSIPSPIKVAEFTVHDRSTPTIGANKQLTLANPALKIHRTSIVDQTLILNKWDAQKMAYTVIARGIVRRMAHVTLSSTHNRQFSGYITFHQNRDEIKMDLDLSNLPTGSYTIKMRQNENMRTNRKSSSPTKLANLSVKNPRLVRGPLIVDKSTGINNLDKIGCYIEIHKASAASNGEPSVPIASGELE